MDAPVVAAALAEMARGDAYAAHARNAPRDANLNTSPGGSGPSPAPPSRAGVSAPRDAHGRGHERARSHWLLLTGVLVGVLVSNAAHATSASGAVLASASASETKTQLELSRDLAFSRENAVSAGRWRALADGFGSFARGAFDEHENENARASKKSSGGTRVSTRVENEDVAAAATSFFSFASETFSRVVAFGRRSVPALDASSFAFGRFAEEAPKSLAEWRSGGGGGASNPARSARRSASFARTADVLGLANCPRTRVLRDALFGDGALAELVGVAEFRDRADFSKSDTKARVFSSRRGGKEMGRDGRRDERRRDDGARRDATADFASSEFANDADEEAFWRGTSPRVFVTRAKPLALFLVCPGVVVALRAHELWGLDTLEGALATALGYAWRCRHSGCWRSSRLHGISNLL